MAQSPTATAAGDSQGLGGMAPRFQDVEFNACNITLVSGNYVQNQNDDRDEERIRLLRPNCASNAYYNSGERHDAPQCHPNTRQAVIGDIFNSILDVNPSGQIIWLYGPAGSGKSSIAQIVAQKCDELSMLAADFFFSRSAPPDYHRGTSNKLVATLARKLSTYDRRMKKCVAEAIALDDLIFSRSLQEQFEALILRPIARAVEEVSILVPGNERPHLSYPSLIILDGLDECSPPESQRNLLSSLTSALDTIPVPLVILIASRPERIIRDEFNGEILGHRTRRIVLDNKYQPDNDIETFLKSRFEDIRRRHPLAATLPSDWPKGSDIRFLVQKASGQFIYASTAMKFVESPVHRPTERLEIILSLLPTENTNPFGELDKIYKNILLSIDEAKVRKALTVLAFLFTGSRQTFSSYRSSYNASLLGTMAFIEDFLGYEAQELVLVFNDLHSLVEVPPSSSSNTAELRLHHASFGDFLQDIARAGSNLFVEMGKYCVEFARICIRHLTPWLYSEDNNILNASAVIQYSFRIFLDLFSIAYPDDDLLRDLIRFPINLFLKRVFDGWIPVFSLLPLLFEWIKSQNLELYHIYNDHYTACIKFRLLTEPISFQPRWSYIFTAVTLNISNSADFSTICKLFVSGSDSDPDQARLIQTHLFGEMNFLMESLDVTDYLRRLRALLLDPSQSGRHHVGNPRYSELAWELFDMFTATNSNILDSLTREENMIIDLFMASLERAGGGSGVLANYMRSSGRRQFNSFAKRHEVILRWRIDAFIQRYGSYQENIQSQEAMLEAVHLASSRSSITSFLSVHDAASEHAFSIISLEEETNGDDQAANAQQEALTSQGMPVTVPISIRGLQNKARELMRKVLH